MHLRELFYSHSLCLSLCLWGPCDNFVFSFLSSLVCNMHKGRKVWYWLAKLCVLLGTGIAEIALCWLRVIILFYFDGVYSLMHGNFSTSDNYVHYLVANTDVTEYEEQQIHFCSEIAQWMKKDQSRQSPERWGKQVVIRQMRGVEDNITEEVRWSTFLT